MNQIRSIQTDCLDGKLSVHEAIETIDELVGGIKNVVFKSGKNFKISNYNKKFALIFNGIKNNQLRRVYGMAVVAYFKAQENGSTHPGEVHISSQASTKHHREGIYEIKDKYLN